MRSLISLVIGLVVGITGAILFSQSMPPEEGSAEERVAKLEVELKRANNRVTALEGSDPNGRHRPGRTVKDGMRSIAQDIRDGKPVTPDDVFRATQPLIRDFAPLFDRIRIRELQRQTDSKVSELARKYSLNPAQQVALKNWLDQNATDEAKRFSDLISQDGVKLEDLARGSRDIRIDDGLDQFMANTLNGEKLTAYKADRMFQKIENVQQEADMKVTRLDSIVQLDDAQRGQIFSVMARGARDFDPAMQFEGLGTDSSNLGSGRPKQDAILEVLRPEQRQAYNAERERRRVEAQKEMESIGLSLPADWDSSDIFDF